jgi:hypothetical protein
MTGPEKIQASQGNNNTWHPPLLSPEEKTPEYDFKFVDPALLNYDQYLELVPMDSEPITVPQKAKLTTQQAKVALLFFGGLPGFIATMLKKED